MKNQSFFSRNLIACTLVSALSCSALASTSSEEPECKKGSWFWTAFTHLGALATGTVFHEPIKKFAAIAFKEGQVKFNEGKVKFNELKKKHVSVPFDYDLPDGFSTSRSEGMVLVYQHNAEMVSRSRHAYQPIAFLKIARLQIQSEQRFIIESNSYKEFQSKVPSATFVETLSGHGLKWYVYDIGAH